MSFAQRLISRLFPGWSAAIEAESRQWELRCTVCGSSRSVWEAGGVRYKAASRGKRLRAYCDQCGRSRWMAVARVDTTRPDREGTATAE